MRTLLEILGFIGAFVVFILIAVFSHERRMRKHKGLSREQFINEFASAGIPRNIPEAVYKHYTGSLFFKNLAVAPDDSLDHVLQKGDDDIEDDESFLLKELGLKPPSEEVRAQWTEQVLASRRKPFDPVPLDSRRWMQPIHTLRDMVLWLNWVREHQQQNAHV
jgi:hypothetical protein